MKPQYYPLTEKNVLRARITRKSKINDVILNRLIHKLIPRLQNRFLRRLKNIYARSQSGGTSGLCESCGQWCGTTCACAPATMERANVYVIWIIHVARAHADGCLCLCLKTVPTLSKYYQTHPESVQLIAKLSHILSEAA